MRTIPAQLLCCKNCEEQPADGVKATYAASQDELRPYICRRLRAVIVDPRMKVWRLNS